MPLARASELDRLLACPGSLVLPRTETRSERAILAGEYGTAVHTWKETGKYEQKFATTIKKKVEAAGVSRDALWAGGLHEVPLAYNVVTEEALALVLPVSNDEKTAWKAGFGNDWVVGTADYVGQILDLPWVDDLKTGRYAEWDSYKHQQTFYALAWGLFAFHSLLPTRCTLTHWPKYPLPKPPVRLGVVLEPDYFLDFKNKLRQLKQDVLRLTTDKERGMDVSLRLSDGEQCVFCPSKSSCTKGQKYE